MDASQFELNEDQRAIQEMAESFAADRVAPHALEWDKNKYFPVDVIKETGPLGFGGLYVKEDVGGSALGRLDAVLVFEALAKACPAFSSFISIHNMSASMIDRYGNEEQ
ncbi:acyl-CoA dehydrogenase, partial [Salmonella enterica subsp. enterica serovar Newport]|nr:acyl-CoA dehydrogenase [Salmonella enterica subsp. enterica serovar Newport]